MLIAKYVKIFSRTGTQPFVLGAVSDWDFLALPPKTIGAVFGPLVPPRHISRRILRIKNALGVLAYSHGTTPYLATFLGLEKLGHSAQSLAKLFPRPPQKGIETVKNIPLEMWAPKRGF